MGDNQIDEIDLKIMDYVAKIPVGGVPRPYAISKAGKTLCTALRDFHGFAIASVAEKKVTARVDLPPAPPSSCALEPHTPTHGLELSPDDRQLWVTSLADGGIYVYDVGTTKTSKENPRRKMPELDHDHAGWPLRRCQQQRQR